MAKKAKIFLAEDQPRIRKMVREFLEGAGHEVAAEAGTLSEAEGKISWLAAAGVSIAMVDGDLGGGKTDGKKLSELLKERIPGIRIIPFSFFEVSWGDAKTSKNSGPEEILRIIAGWLAE